MYLGLDLGTSGLKGMLIDEAQAVIATAAAPLQVNRPREGWSEQDPDDWIAAAEAVLDALAAKAPAAMAALRGIGLSGQMHGATLLGADDRPLRPAILWNDTRAHEEAARLDAMPDFRRLTGNIVFPGFTAPKLEWVRAQEPEIFDKVAKVLLPKDYLRLWLTGMHVSDMSDASGTAWFDPRARAWSAPLLAATQMDRAQMPDLVEGSEVSAGLRESLAQRWGLTPGLPVAGGGGDNAASAVGLGVIHEGEAFVSIGTSGVLFAATGAFRPDPESAVHAFCHALPGRWHQMGVILAAADALNWYARLTGLSAAHLTGELGEKLAPPGRTLFLPYLGGERTPYNDAAIRAAFTGLGHGDDRAALTRAVLEGVAYAFRDSLEALHAAGTVPARLLAVGGGALSRYWLGLIATVLGLPVDIPEEGDFGGAFGAARLGLLAAEGADPAVICTPPRIVDTIAPDPALAPAFAEAHARYKQTYQSIREI